MCKSPVLVGKFYHSFLNDGTNWEKINNKCIKFEQWPYKLQYILKD